MRLVETLKARASILIFAGVGLGVAGYEWHQAQSVSLVSVAAAHAKPAAATVLAEGRIVAYPDARVTLGAELPGKLVKLRVHEQDHVAAGDVIAEVDVKEQRAALREAWARVKEAESDVSYLATEQRRSETLFAENVVARAAYDKSNHDAESAGRRRSALVATAARLEAEVDKATLVAPFAGTVTERFAEPGQFVATGAPIVSLVDLGRLRVEAEIGEFDVARVALGKAATLRAEGYPQAWRGTIEEIPVGVVPRQLRPQDPARPVDTRVLLVKIRLDEAVPLRLGQRVEVEIH
jgi:RND family efflux transporter MFP subunit